jgi:PII-like signaling protein
MRKLEGEQVLVRIILGEGEKHGHRPLYLEIVDILRREGIAGATVLRGIAGFGAKSVLHTLHLLDLSADLPVLVEIVDSEERLAPVLAKIEPLLESGLVTTERVHVVRYGKSATPP